MKGYLLLLNLFGGVGPVLEGTGVTQGLKNNEFKDMHSQIRSRTEDKVTQFIDSNGYVPPYWQLVAMAQDSTRLFSEDQVLKEKVYLCD